MRVLLVASTLLCANIWDCIIILHFFYFRKPAGKPTNYDGFNFLQVFLKQHFFSPFTMHMLMLVYKFFFEFDKFQFFFFITSSMEILQKKHLKAQ